MPSRVAIIGAGLAGLTAANHLIDQGAAVTIFERAGEAGGRASTIVHDGYRFNQGPHALYVDGEGVAVLRALGIEPRGHAPVLTKAAALFEGELHTLPMGPAGLASTRLLGVKEKLRVGSFLARLGRLDPTELTGVTINEWVATITTDTRPAELIRALLRLSTYSNAPDVASAGPALAQLQRAVNGGVLYLDGGWGQLVDRLDERTRSAGAKHEQAVIGHVDELLGDFDAVVVAAGSPTVTDSLVGSAGSEVVAGPPVQAAVLELGVASIPARRFILGIDEPVYGSVHAPPADLAPPGHSVVCFARYLAPGERHDADRTRRELTALAGRLDIPETDIVTSRYLHRMTVSNGQPLAARCGLAGRPTVDLAGDPRIAVAGDWVGPAGLLGDASFASGRDAARHVLRAKVAM